MKLKIYIIKRKNLKRMVRFIMKYFFSFLIFFLVITIHNSTVSALTMSNPDYKIETDTLNINDYNNMSLNNTDENNLKGTLQGVNYTLQNGFASVDSSGQLSFSISPDVLNFGTLSAGEPITRIVDLNIKNETGYHFLVSLYQDHPLRSERKIDIPDTTCDNGTCSELISSFWLNPLTYGFGYSCKNITGSACLSDFDGLLFKQFPDEENQERSNTVLFSQLSESSSQVIFKINISGIQEIDTYFNTIFLIASVGY